MAIALITMAFLKFNRDTWIKLLPEQSDTLTDFSKVAIKGGEVYELHSYAIAPHDHLKVAFKNRGFGVANRNTWFAYAPHISVVDADGDLVLLPSGEDEDSAPNVQRKTPPDEPLAPREGDRTRVVRLSFGKSIDLLGKIPGSKHFSWGEATHAGSRLPQRIEHYNAIVNLARELDKARDQIGKPFEITSWYRPEPFNRRAGGSRMSQHLFGNAADIKVAGMTGRQLAKELSWWKGGLGIYPNLPNIIHLDNRAYRARWGL